MKKKQNDVTFGFKMILYLRTFVKFFAIFCSVYLLKLKNELDKISISVQNILSVEVAPSIVKSEKVFYKKY